MKWVPDEEVNRRIENLRKNMNGIDAVLILQNVDMFYFSGTVQQGFIFVPASGDPLFFVRRIPERAKDETPLEVIPIKGLRDAGKILSDFKVKILGMEWDVVPVAIHKRYLKLFENAESVDISGTIRDLRKIKTPFEQAKIRKAAEITKEVIEEVKSHLKRGMTEWELISLIEYLAKLRGHLGPTRMRAFGQELFFGHVLSDTSGGVSAYADAPTGGYGRHPTLGHGATSRPLRENTPIDVDFMVNYEGYLSDQTRIFVIGKLSPELVKGYEFTKNLIRELEGMIRPGTLASEIYDHAVKRAEGEGYKENFMGYGPYKVSFVGHGVGLEVDEYPFIARGFDMPLEAGMVFALEPKLIFPGKGMVGIENTYLVTDSGFEKLTTSDENIHYVRFKEG